MVLPCLVTTLVILLLTRRVSVGDMLMLCVGAASTLSLVAACWWGNLEVRIWGNLEVLRVTERGAASSAWTLLLCASDSFDSSKHSVSKLSLGRQT